MTLDNTINTQLSQALLSGDNEQLSKLLEDLNASHVADRWVITSQKSVGFK